MLSLLMPVSILLFSPQKTEFLKFLILKIPKYDYPLVKELK